MNLLILEDEKILLDKYSDYLHEHFDSIMKAQNLSQAQALSNENEFDVALIDYNLPDGFGLDLVKQYPASADAPVFVMLTAYSKERVAIDSLNSGVYRYIEKPIEKQKLHETMLKAKEEAHNRESLRTLKRKFTISEKAIRVLSDDYFLSKRELDVLEAILVHGKNKIAAQKLFIGQGTVRNHLSAIFQKLHVENKEKLSEFIEKLNS